MLAIRRWIVKISRIAALRTLASIADTSPGVTVRQVMMIASSCAGLDSQARPAASHSPLVLANAGLLETHMREFADRLDRSR